jgi:hypothetical protein
MAGRERLKRAFVLEADSSTEWLKGLGTVGIAFPQNYVLCGEVQALVPYYLKEHVRLWRPLVSTPSVQRFRGARSGTRGKVKLLTAEGIRVPRTRRPVTVIGDRSCSGTLR